VSSLRVVIEADGGSRGNPGPAGYGAVLRDADTGAVLREVAAGIGVASNNVAEYRGLIAGLTAAIDLGADEVDVRMDSLLVVNQMKGDWKVKHEAMKPLASEAAALVRRLPVVRFRHVPRAQNSHADRLANEAMDDAARGLDWQPRTEVPEPEPEPAARPKSGWSAPTGQATTTVLVRHGETPLSVERRFSGTGDPELSDRGRDQAAAAAQRLAALDVDAVITSPRARARATAEAIATALGVEALVDDAVAETDFGDWEGHTFAEIRQQWPDELAAWLADPDVAPPGGESFTATFKRVADWRERVVATYPGKTVIVVSHVTPIKALLREALDAPPHVLYRIHLDPASVSTVDWYADTAGVVRLVNDTSHLTGRADSPRR
jgi:ribonuclease H / adenosylcobalamin/alpha-ribazole phosphatase